VPEGTRIKTPTPAAARATRVAQALTALLALAYAGARFPGPFALLDNLSNFPAHFAAAFLACGVVLAFLRNARWAIVAAAGLALALAQVLPWYAGSDDPASPGLSVKLLISNVNQGNRQHGLLERLVANEDPDVVGLVEVNQRWQRELGFLRARYPHHYELPDERFVGLGLYSRLPLEDVRTMRIPGGFPPVIAATLKAPRGDVEILIVHPVPPINASLVRRRNEQIRGLADYARTVAGPLVMAGDFNITMWNVGYRPLEDVGGLRNARRGQGIRPTWPALGPLGVPIDHVLASPGVELHVFRVLPAIGSDHLPIAAEFSLR
jgi:endonuclease/exonuclease/phosphatase (EEP) superfamily protein YafD